MPYYDAYLIPIRPSKLEAYREFSKKVGAVYREYGALEVTDIILDEGAGSGEQFHAEEARAYLGDALRDFFDATATTTGETVVLSLTKWPDKSSRDKGLAGALADSRIQPNPDDEVIFDGKRLVSGAFSHFGDW